MAVLWLHALIELIPDTDWLTAMVDGRNKVFERANQYSCCQVIIPDRICDNKYIVNLNQSIDLID
jgi:hypothetical protein